MIGRIINLDGTPGLRVSNLTSVDSMYHLRVKSLTTGITTDFIGRPVDIDGKGDVMPIHGFYDEYEQVAFRAEPINRGCFMAWFESDDPIGLCKYAKMTDKEAEQQNVPDIGVPSGEMFDSTGPTAPAEDQDHEQDHQDHESEPGPDVVQNEPELTTLQVQILQELKENGEGTVAELIDRLNMPGMQAAIRKNLHILMDEKHLIGKRSSTQNGRPAQLWGVM